MDKICDVAFGLAFDVEKCPETKSGFKPAVTDRSQLLLFADLRLDGFAALLRIGLANSLRIVGGNEGRYKSEVINRAEAIRRMLVEDHGLEATRVGSFASGPSTEGNIQKIKEMIESDRLDFKNCTVISNFYHLPRVSLFLKKAGVPIPIYPAEAFWLLEENEKNARRLIERLDGSELGEGKSGPALAERIAGEIQGITDMLRGTYKSLTNTSIGPNK